MKYLDEYRDPALAGRLADKIRSRPLEGLHLMEFCGTHTVSVMRNGLRQLLRPTVEMHSGPGCPVCVTAVSELDRAIALAEQPGVTLATFGDMLKVPGSRTTLQRIRAEGGDVRVVYSALDALEMAEKAPERTLVFLGVGFETTAPTVAAAVLEARARGLSNFRVLSLHKLCPPVMQALLDSGDIRLDGILCPGHVSTIIGTRPYEFIPREYGIACVIAGFEPLDILMAVDMLLGQIRKGEPKVEIAYLRGVDREGNREALRVMDRVFEPEEARWRGIGPVPASGLRLRKVFRAFDAEAAFSPDLAPAREPEGCLCGEILRGTKTPLDCKLFGRACTPENPIGPCMVSSEGTCSAYYLYGDADGR